MMAVVDDIDDDDDEREARTPLSLVEVLHVRGTLAFRRRSFHALPTAPPAA